MLLHRNERRAELVLLGDTIGDRYGLMLCETHLMRAKPPKGWTLVDRRDPTPSPARPRVHGAPGSSTNPVSQNWSPTRGSQLPDALISDRSPVLRRAFLGFDKGLPGLERVDDQIDSDPERLGDGVKQYGHRSGNTDGDRGERDELHIGPHQQDAGHERDGDQSEREDCVHADGADEVTGLALKDVAAPGALLTQPQEPVGQATLAANSAASREAAQDQAEVAGRHSHAEEPNAGQLRLAV